MRPSEIQDAYRKAMKDYWFDSDYAPQIAIATIEYYKKIVELFGQYKQDKEIKKQYEYAKWFSSECEKSTKEGAI